MNKDTLMDGDFPKAIHPPLLRETPSCADQLKVLADETRLAIIEQLFSGPKHVNKINETLRVEQSLLSHHLKVLRQAGFVLAERDGKSIMYRLAPAVTATQKSKAINLGCCFLSFG